MVFTALPHRAHCAKLMPMISSTKKFISGATILIIVLVTVIYFSATKSIPSAAQVKDIVLQHCIDSLKCNGKVTGNSITISGIGDYQTEFGGYPVYGNCSITCLEDIPITLGLRQPYPNPLTHVRSKTFGGYEVFSNDLAIKIKNGSYP